MLAALQAEGNAQQEPIARAPRAAGGDGDDDGEPEMGGNQVPSCWRWAWTMG